MEKAQNHYVWANFKNVGELRINRLTALEDCTDDIVKGSGRYVPATWPTLPFTDQQFDLVPSAHFLFMYGDHLNYHFHIETINELLRVAKEEIRIFSYELWMYRWRSESAIWISKECEHNVKNNKGCEVEEQRSELFLCFGYKLHCNFYKVC